MYPYCQICGNSWLPDCGKENPCLCNEKTKESFAQKETRIYELERKLDMYRGPVRLIIDKYVHDLQSKEEVTIKSSDMIDLWKATENCYFDDDTYYKYSRTVGHYLSIVIWADHLFSNKHYPIGNHLQKLKDLKEKLIKYKVCTGELEKWPLEVTPEEIVGQKPDGLITKEDKTWLRNFAKHWILVWIGVNLKVLAKKIGIPV